jgi:hypothetical protein
MTNTYILDALIGKKIKGVVVKRAKSYGTLPASQVFLIFDDDLSLEMYSSGTICFGSGLDSGGMDAVKRYISDAMEIVFTAKQEDDHPGVSAGD